MIQKIIKDFGINNVIQYGNSMLALQKVHRLQSRLVIVCVYRLQSVVYKVNQFVIENFIKFSYIIQFKSCCLFYYLSLSHNTNRYYQARLYLYRYLLNTCKYQIVYNRLSDKSVVVHSNLDWAQDLKSCKSITGDFILIACKVTFQISYQKKTIVLSLTKAKYMAFSNCSYQLVWIRNLFNKVGFNIMSMIITLAHFSEILTLYKRSASNILIFTITI